MMPRIEIPDLAPRDAVDHFRAKGCHVGFDHRDTAAAEHLASLTVARVARIDILVDIRKAVDAALAGGWTLGRFRGELGPLRRRKGWWGRRMMTDPLTGETRPVQPGSARRLGIILDTSLRMAWARGRWQAIRRLAHMRPWLRCVAIPDARTRPATRPGHAGWHGTVLRRDHPAWKTHYPPCGGYCRCTVRQMSDRDPERLGLKPSQAPPEDRSKNRPWNNARTGRTIEVPMGIDPGLGHNVGLLRADAPAGAVLQARAAAAVIRPRKPGDWIAEGRTLRERMVEDAGGIDAPDLIQRFRDNLRNRLGVERGAGTADAQIDVGVKGSRTAMRVRKAAAELPASWVTRANTLPLTATGASKRGFHRPARPPKSASQPISATRCTNISTTSSTSCLNPTACSRPSTADVPPPPPTYQRRGTRQHRQGQRRDRPRRPVPPPVHGPRIRSRRGTARSPHHGHAATLPSPVRQGVSA